MSGTASAMGGRGAECVEDYEQGRERVGHLGRKHERRLPLQTHESRLVPVREERELRQECERHHLAHRHPCCPLPLSNFCCWQALL